LLLGCRLLPVAADGRRRHALEVDVGKYFLVDERDHLADVAGPDRLVGLDRFEDVGRDFLDEGIGRLRALGLRAEGCQRERRCAEPADRSSHGHRRSLKNGKFHSLRRRRGKIARGAARLIT
jgi:hypothetical protein